MARRRKEDDEEPAPKPGPIRLFFRFINTTIVLALILYAALRAVTFTAGFRNLIEEQVLAKFDLPVKIDSIRSNWRCDLEFSGVAVTNSGTVRADRIALDWSLADALQGRVWNLRRLEVSGCAITFVARHGAWEPAALAPISDALARWLEISLPAPSNGVPVASTGAVAQVTAERTSLWSNTIFSVSDLSLAWRTGGTGDLAAVDGVSVEVSPLQVPGRNMRYYHLRLHEARLPDGAAIRNVNLEMIDSGDQQVVLGFQAERQKAAARRVVQDNASATTERGPPAPN